jgi:tol-pal system protein YbgF
VTAGSRLRTRTSSLRAGPSQVVGWFVRPAALRPAICLLVSITSLLPLGGCFSQRFDALDRELARAREEIRQLRTEEEERAARVALLEERGERLEEALRLDRATGTTRHQQVIERISRLEAGMSDSGDRVGILAQRMDEARWVAPPIPDTGEAPESGGSPREMSGAAEAQALAPGAELRRAYEAARLDMTQGHYDLAASAFREFLRRYPASELSDNAQYWLGECFYAQQEFDDALIEFQRVIASYPRGDKVPAAFLKMGFSLLAIGSREDAISLLKRVASEYPHTAEADRALERLRSLAEAPEGQ